MDHNELICLNNSRMALMARYGDDGDRDSKYYLVPNLESLVSAAEP